jgi:hypothetical protein
VEKKQVVHISVHQTSKVIAAMHAVLITVLFILPSVIGYWYNGQVVLGFVMLILLPLFMWVLLYIGYVVACWFYNLVVPWTGGIEVEVAGIGMPKNIPEPPVVPPEDKITPPTNKKDLL